MANKSVFSKNYGIFLRELKTARKEAGLSQEALAEKLGQTQSFVSKFERGERRIDVIELRLICSALEMPFVEFVQRLEKRLK